MLRPAKSRGPAVASGEAGFTMAIVMFVLLITTTLTLGAFAATGGDLRLNQNSTDSKKAYAAAESGVAFYLSKLADNNDYWKLCTDDNTQPVNQPWNGVQPDPRRWKDIPKTTSEAGEARAEYTLELIPTKTGTPPVRRAACDPADQASMIDQATGTFTLRSTGRIGGKVARSVLATFRRKSFLDSVYANDVEFTDPGLIAAQETTYGPGFRAWVASQAGCAGYQRDGRDDNRYTYGTRSYTCGENTIVYAASDKLNGPFHSNDGVKIQTCGQTVFGRPGLGDLVEFYDSRYNSGGLTGAQCDGILGNSIVRRGDNYDKILPPQSNQQLADTALPDYRYSGETRFKLTGTTMTVTVTNPTVPTTTTTTTGVALPPNGVISVLDSGGACPGYNVAYPNVAQPACGTAFVEGSYGKNLTITSARDIVITDDLRKSGDTLLGLVATDYTRVKRTMASYPCTSSTGDNSETGRIVEAAILSLNHVFTADSYACGNENGVLKVTGSIAQKFRGPVATTGGTGYDKDYSYDDRLRYRSPPFFLNPVQASWKVVRTQERTPVD